MPEPYDCVVVGAGCWGAWIALRLRERGRSVALLEAWEPGHARSSSGGASRIIRMGYGAAEIFTRWAMRSLSDWQELFARVGRPELFQPTGVLWTARAGHAHSAATRAALDRAGVRYEALAADEVSRRYPQIRFAADVTGILEPQSGALLASRAVQAVAEEAVRMGVEPLAGRVLPPRHEERLACIETEDGRKIAGGAFVFACGPWLPKLFPRLLADRIQVTRQEVFYFAPPAGNSRLFPPSMPVWIDFSDQRGGYALPPLAGMGFKLALDQHGPPYDPDTGGREASAEAMAASRAFLRERFPDLAQAPQMEVEVCQYENTANGDFLIDRHPQIENVWISGGGSGHGFKHGPAVGDYVARVMEGEAGAEPRFSFAAIRGRSRTVF